MNFPRKSNIALFLFLLIFQIALATSITNPSFEESYSSGGYERPTGWDFKDGLPTNYWTKTSSAFNPDGTNYDLPSPYGTNTAWNQNGDPGYMYVQQDIDLSGASEFKFTIIVGGHGTRATHDVYIDGTHAKDCGSYNTDGSWETCTVNVGGYSGTHTVQLRSTHISADNMGSNTYDEVRLVSSNSAPNNPSNPAPFNGESAVSTNHNLNVDVSDPDGESMDIDFYVDGSYIGTDSGVCSGCTASINPSLTTGTSYSWYAVADDGTATKQSSTWSFTTVHKPDNPINPLPSDTASDVSTNSNLEVDVTHPDGLNMDVTFRINNGSEWRTVGVDTGVTDGGTASVNPDLTVSGSYDWYAEASASGYTTQSSTWNFTTGHETNASLLSPSDGATTISTNPVLEASVEHSSPDRTVDLYFIDADNGQVLKTVSNIGDGETALYNSSGDSFGNNTGNTYNWKVNLTGEENSENYSSQTWNFTTVHEPEIDQASASPQGGKVVSTTPELSVDVNHGDNEMMYVTFFLNGEAFGTDQKVDGSGTASIKTDQLAADTVYDWNVVVEDDNGNIVDNQDAPWSFETDTGNPNISVEYGDNVNFYPDSVVLDVIPTHSHADNVDYVRLLDENGNIVDEVQNVDTDKNVSLLWEGLNHDRRYNWTAEVEHSGETAQSAEASFTTLTVGVDLLNEVNNAERYNLYRRSGVSGENANFDSGEGDYQYIGTATSLQLIDASENLQPGDYCYVATAENLGGESSPSDEMCIEGVQVNP